MCRITRRSACDNLLWFENKLGLLDANFGGGDWMEPLNHTYIDWSKKNRRVRNEGPGKIVEIDEAKSIVLQHQQQLDHIFGRPVLHSCSATPAAYACSATAAAATTAAALAGEAGGAT
ncbi:hypothetical protein ACLKA7_005636 [Drosophila subpalustris]